MNYQDKIDVEATSDEEYSNDDLSDSDTEPDKSEDENIGYIIKDLVSTLIYFNDLKKQYRKYLPPTQSVEGFKIEGCIEKLCCTWS